MRTKRLSIKLQEILFFAGIFMKQFYLQQSGTAQISDILIITAFFLFIIQKKKVSVCSADKPILIFVICTFIINGIYFLYYGTEFIISSIYFLYNLFVILLFRQFSADDHFLDAFIKVIKIILLTQLLIFLSGNGRYYGTIRYRGTFNDPNQFGFFVICCFFLLYLTSYHFGKKLHIGWYILLGMFVILSSSTGMTLAYAVFLFFTVYMPLIANKNVSIKILSFFAFVGIFGVIIVYGEDFLIAVQRATNWKPISSIIDRLIEKNDKASGESGLMEILRDRQMLRLISVPQYFIYGCGEGLYSRFLPLTGQNGEIHCTMLALWYDYGIIPYSFFLYWLWKNLKGIPKDVLPVFLALILEAFTLANHRQPFFWMIFVLGAMLAKDSPKRTILRGTEHNEIQHYNTNIQGSSLS